MANATKTQVCAQRRETLWLAGLLAAESTLNPLDWLNLARQVAAPPEPAKVSWRAAHRQPAKADVAANELVELQISEDEGSIALASELGARRRQGWQRHGRRETNWNGCTCPRMPDLAPSPRHLAPGQADEDDKLAAASPEIPQAAPQKRMPVVEPAVRLLAAPSGTGQMGEFGARLTRKKLLRHQVHLARRKVATIDLQSICLYEAQRLAEDANLHSANMLGQLAQHDLKQLRRHLCAANDAPPPQPARELVHGLPLGIRLATGRRSAHFKARGASSSASSSGQSDSDSGLASELASLEAAFGSSPATTDDGCSSLGRRRQLRRREERRLQFGLADLRRVLEFEASAQFRRIVALSCRQFENLLSITPLLTLQVDQAGCPLQRLKLFASVECQKLRANLRFDWLPKCLWLAFEHLGEPRGRGNRPSKQKALPELSTGSGPQDEQFELNYLRALDRLLGRLLRHHFLERALESLLASVASQLKCQPLAGAAPHFLLPVELDERADGQLELSRPAGALCGALEFVVDELAAAATRLPSVLEQLGASSSSPGPKCIVVLTTGDDLLARKRERLAELVCGAQQAQEWVSRNHLRVIKIVNELRASAALSEGQLEALSEGDAELAAILAAEPEEESAGASAKQLAATCKQVRLLECLARRLACQLGRHFDLGRLVRLDCARLNEQLLKLVDSERALLVRLHADELWRLMEGLRLQLDELKLGLELESTIEDYLSRRRQIRQSQQPELEQRLLLEGNMEQELEAELAERRRSAESAVGQQSEESDELGELVGSEMVEPEAEQSPEQDQAQDQEEDREEDPEEEFANALVGNNNPNVAQLFALSNPNGTPLGEMVSIGELGVGARGLAPLVECRLLLGRYQRLNQFLANELRQFLDDSQFATQSGLVFLTEHLPSLSATSSRLDSSCNGGELQFEAQQLELIGELVLRTKNFGRMLNESLGRLNKARQKLLASHRLRSEALNRVCLEFEWLVQQLSLKRLAELRAPGEEARNSIKRLDLIQEAASWALKLARRRDFLASQNELLHREARHLFACQQFEFGSLERPEALARGAWSRPAEVASSEQQPSELPTERRLEFERRHMLLDQWEQFVRLASSFWQLAEEFETQQVKWLNSESRKLDFDQLERTFRNNFAREHVNLTSALELMRSASGGDKLRQQLAVLDENLRELGASLEEFEHRLLPIFKFLTNRHLTQEYWVELNKLLEGLVRPDSATGALARPGPAELRLCSTVAQLLELNVDRFVVQLDSMSHRATIEHHLSSLLAAETARLGRRRAQWATQPPLASQLESLRVCALLDDWSEHELELAAQRFLKFQLQRDAGTSLTQQSSHSEPAGQEVQQIELLARQLVAYHTCVRRFLRLRNELNLVLAAEPSLGPHKPAAAGRRQPIVLRDNMQLRSSQQVRASLLLEFLRLFAQTWLETRAQLEARLARVEAKLAATSNHLRDIDELLGRVRSLADVQLQEAERESELSQSRLQRDSIRLELEREVLATREALAQARQRKASRARDLCVRQISERAIPAIRAATRALECLGDGRSLRALRSYRPRPPLAIRLVIEAVCLLRNAAAGAGAEPSFPTSPTRHFDALRGQMVEDYWPIAWRTLNALHSAKLVQELRQLNRRLIPRPIVRLVRRKYLSRAEFNVGSIERVSRQAGLLARWLVAVDVFDRVINIVRPNYEQCRRAERELSQLLADLAHRRHQIQTIGQQLGQMSESLGAQVQRQAKLVDLMDECSGRAEGLEQTRGELAASQEVLNESAVKLRARMRRLAPRCLWQSARLVYLDALAPDERPSIERAARRSVRQLDLERPFPADVGLEARAKSSGAA